MELLNTLYNLMGLVFVLGTIGSMTPLPCRWASTDPERMFWIPNGSHRRSND